MESARDRVPAMEMPNQQRSFRTNMVRAREVWAAAFPKKPGLDLLNAKKLGRDLDWASTWMRVDTTHTKESDANALREHLENIERAARNLWKLIGSAKLVDQVAELLSYNYPAVPNFADLEVHLKDLEKAAHKAKECQRRTMPSKGFSALKAPPKRYA